MAAWLQSGCGVGRDYALTLAEALAADGVYVAAAVTRARVSDVRAHGAGQGQMAAVVGDAAAYAAGAAAAQSDLLYVAECESAGARGGVRRVGGRERGRGAGGARAAEPEPGGGFAVC